MAGNSQVYYSREQAAPVLSVSLRFLDMMIADGRLDHVKLGRRTMIPADKLRDIRIERIKATTAK